MNITLNLSKFLNLHYEEMNGKNDFDKRII